MTDTITIITGQQLIAKVRELAAAQPTRTAKCNYTSINPSGTDIQPECIIGHAVVECGFPVAELNCLGGSVGSLISSINYNSDPNYRRPVGQRQWGFKVELSDVELQWLYEVQKTQDAGNTWHSAVQFGDNMVSISNTPAST